MEKKEFIYEMFNLAERSSGVSSASEIRSCMDQASELYDNHICENSLFDITHRNYLATVRRGLITPDTLLWDFIAKLKEEVKELDESFPEDWSELADIALVCFAMAEHYGIDLVDEMRKKTEFNEKRKD